jgi:hypothetical protein
MIPILNERRLTLTATIESDPLRRLDSKEQLEN